MLKGKKSTDWAAEDSDDASAPTTASSKSSAIVKKKDSEPFNKVDTASLSNPKKNRWEMHREIHGDPLKLQKTTMQYSTSKSKSSRYHDRTNSREYGNNEYEQVQLPIEQGYIVSIKDTFGFISCVDREGDLFFHLTEAPRDIKEQDEVEFKVSYNPRSEKDIAIQLQILPKNTIIKEYIEPTWYNGIVLRQISQAPSSSRYRERDSSRQEGDNKYGTILIESFKKEDDVEEEKIATGDVEYQSMLQQRIRFTMDSGSDVEALCEDDEVTLQLAKHRISGKMRAIHVTLTMSAQSKHHETLKKQIGDLTRETGIIERVNRDGGVIKCRDRIIDILYSVKDNTMELDVAPEGMEFVDPNNLKVKDEVSFYAVKDPKGNDGSGYLRSRHQKGTQEKFLAVGILRLPSGSVIFEKIVEIEATGNVMKLPRDSSRSGVEVVGTIECDSKTEGVPSTCLFRMCDTMDENYHPGIGDIVTFSLVYDYRRTQHKAINVKLLNYNPKNRFTGSVVSLKHDFGFIKCVEKAVDIYFRFADILPSKHSGSLKRMESASSTSGLRVGDDVAFDVITNSTTSDKDGSLNLRAQRIELLPPGTVVWEEILQEDMEGMVVSLPSNVKSARGQYAKYQQRQFDTSNITPGKIMAKSSIQIINFMPDLKSEIDKIFINQISTRQPELGVTDDYEQKVEDEKNGTNEMKNNAKKDTGAVESTVEFPSSLSKYERAAIHAYCDYLGFLQHKSVGTGSNRKLIVTGIPSVTAVMTGDIPSDQRLDEATSNLKIDFNCDAFLDARYDVKVNDCVRFQLVMSKQTKQILAKKISFISKGTDIEDQKLTGDGVITSLKKDGFGFIKPMGGEYFLQDPNAAELFFHCNEITTGETFETLSLGTEVQYSVYFDEKKKKTKARSIRVVPLGTIDRSKYQSHIDKKAVRVYGLIQKPSLLHKLKTQISHRGKNTNDYTNSTIGKIVVHDTQAGNLEHKESLKDENPHGTSVPIESVDNTSSLTNVASPTKTGRTSVYHYHLNDVVDPSVILREGDEVSFIPQESSKGMRAAKIEVVSLHSKRGIVSEVNSKQGFGRILLVDSGDTANSAEIKFPEHGILYFNKNVLRGDILQVGDHVEFGISLKNNQFQTANELHSTQKAQSNRLDSTKKSNTEVDIDANASNVDTADIQQTQESVDEASTLSTDRQEKSSTSLEKKFDEYLATSILKIPSATDQKIPSRNSRPINSSLKEAMKKFAQNSGLVASRTAKGPDGTRGFKDGWKLQA